jgi:D-tyrosyl-tRNA(Tyr) deacylase
MPTAAAAGVGQPSCQMVPNLGSFTTFPIAMRACVQRVSRAEVIVGGEAVGRIARGLVVLLGVAADDTDEDARQLAQKIVDLRIFEDDAGKMNRSLLEAGGALLVVSQFTLLGDCRKGRRPSFVAAAPPELAQRLYEAFVGHVRALGVEVATGRFRAQMQVALVNEGPVTLLLDSRKLF